MLLWHQVIKDCDFHFIRLCFFNFNFYFFCIFPWVIRSGGSELLCCEQPSESLSWGRTEAPARDWGVLASPSRTSRWERPWLTALLQPCQNHQAGCAHAPDPPKLWDDRCSLLSEAAGLGGNLLPGNRELIHVCTVKWLKEYDPKYC